MTGLIDTHAHLCDRVFDPDLPAVLGKAASAGIAAVIAVGETIEDAQKNLDLAANNPMILPAAGLYPTMLDLNLAEQMCGFIRDHRAQLVAIGEVGLDHWIVKEEADQGTQREIFRAFISLSKELGLPLNVHSRSAGRHAVNLLLEEGATRVQMHAFDGKYSTASAAVEAGFFFSIPPSVVRSEQKRKLLKHLPLSCLLVETDSPVLGPLAQERNEPANAIIALKTIAELKGVDEAEIRESIVENTRRLYGNTVAGYEIP